MRSSYLLVATFGLLAETPVAAQSIRYSDLAGATIETSAITKQTYRMSGGEERTTRVTYTSTIRLGAGDRLQYTQAASFTAGDGKTKSRSWSADATLGKPHAFRDGQAVWIFKDSTLIRLRTLSQGGALSTIKIARRPDNSFTCTLQWSNAREAGGKVFSDSTVTGIPIEILSEKLISSHCQVVKQ